MHCNVRPGHVAPAVFSGARGGDQVRVRGHGSVVAGQVRGWLDALDIECLLAHQDWISRALPAMPVEGVESIIKALTRDRDRLLATQQAVESQLRMILEAYHPAPVRLFSSVDRQITLSFVLDYPTPATASRVKTTRMNGFLSRHHYTGRRPGRVLAEPMRANLLSGSTGTAEASQV